MNVVVKNIDEGIKKVIINDPKTYNSSSFKTLIVLFFSYFLFKFLIFIFLIKHSRQN